MSKFEASMDRDANFQVIGGDYPFRAKKAVTFTGAAGSNTWGDDGGTLDGAALFTVTGIVKVKMFAACPTLLDSDGAATLAVGIAGATTLFLPTETATQIDAGQFWINNAANAAYAVWGEEAAAADNFPEYLLYGQDIILTVAGGANVTAGVLDFYILWKPISDDGNVVDSGL
jgi:hypothetical protein